MKLIRAKHLGMCFGVRDAIALATETARHHPLTILGDLVHNDDVLNRLRERGIVIENNLRQVRTSTVMVTAHGISDRRRADLDAHGARVLEGTCPLVHGAHRAVQDLARAGYHPVIVGVANHVEVRGITEDLAAYDVILSADDVARLRERPRYGVAAQTTQPIERVWRLADLMRQRFPAAEVRVVDTVCRPTKLRQWAAERLGASCEVVIVVGGARSNNSRELAETCRRGGARVYQVERADDVRREWVRGVEVVGLTAGTSTPDEVVDGVELRLREYGSSEVEQAAEKAASYHR